MPDRDRACLGRAARTDLPQGRLHFVDEKVKHVAGTLRPQRPQAPQEGLARKDRISAERDRSDHVEPGADAAVQHDHHPAADGTTDGGERVDRCRETFHLTSAMIRHNDAIDPESRAALGVRRVQDPLHDQWTLPALAVARDLIPGKRAAHFSPHEARHLVHVRRRGGIWLEITEPRLTMLPQRSEIAG